MKEQRAKETKFLALVHLAEMGMKRKNVRLLEWTTRTRNGFGLLFSSRRDRNSHFSRRQNE